MQKKIPLKRLGITALVLLFCGVFVFFCCSQRLSYKGILIQQGKEPVEAQLVLKSNNFHRIIRQAINGNITIYLNENNEEYFRAKYNGHMFKRIDPHFSTAYVYVPWVNSAAIATFYFDDSFDELAFTMEPYATFYSSEPFYQAVCERYELDTP
ncbi:MAG: hypothetical protein HFE45_08605 [Oscillospiraceae bacterium]|jgi:hypothetical protein|nr:hypothetical protein [Oscillospiraceae bacterium]